MSVDTLSAVLQGLNNGARTGLDLYKTMREEERLKRNEAYRLSRDAIEDTRYAEEAAYRKDADSLAQSNWQKTFDAGREDARTRAEAEERRHRETLALTRLRMDSANARASLKYGTENRKIIRQDLTNAFDGSADGFSRGIQLINSSASHHAEALTSVRNMGYDVPDDVAGRLRAVPMNDGRVMFGVQGDDGRISPYDPDGEGGQSALVMPGSMFAGLVGGKAGAGSADAFYARTGAAGAVESQAAGLEAQSPKLAERANKVSAEADKQDFANEIALNGPAAAFVAQQEAARAGAETDFLGETRTWVDPATGKTVIEQGGASNSPETLAALRAAKKTRDELAATVIPTDGLRSEATTLRTQAGRVKEQADSLRNGWSALDARLNALPAEKQVEAFRNTGGSYLKNPTVASLFLTEDAHTGSVKMREAREKMAADVVSNLSVTVGKDEKGKAIKMDELKPQIEGVILSMPDSTLAAYLDESGQATGALKIAAQKAAKLKQPEAIPYLLEASRRDIPDEEAVRVMQDPALMKIKDPAVRFELASGAFDLLNTGKAPDVETALGMLLK